MKMTILYLGKIAPHCVLTKISFIQSKKFCLMSAFLPFFPPLHLNQQLPHSCDLVNVLIKLSKQIIVFTAFYYRCKQTIGTSQCLSSCSSSHPEAQSLSFSAHATCLTGELYNRNDLDDNVLICTVYFNTMLECYHRTKRIAQC